MHSHAFLILLTPLVWIRFQNKLNKNPETCQPNAAQKHFSIFSTSKPRIIEISQKRVSNCVLIMAISCRQGYLLQSTFYTGESTTPALRSLFFFLITAIKRCVLVHCVVKCYMRLSSKLSNVSVIWLISCSLSLKFPLQSNSKVR